MGIRTFSPELFRNRQNKLLVRWTQRRPIPSKRAQPALVTVVIFPDALEAWHHLTGEQFARMAGLFGWHIPQLEQADNVPDAQTINQLLHALAHGFRTAGDDVAELDP